MEPYASKPRIRLPAALLALGTLALACAGPGDPLATSSLPQEPPSAAVSSPTPFPPGSAETPAPGEPTAPPGQTAPPSGQPTGFHGLVVPEGWYYITVTDSGAAGAIEALAFTPIDPAKLAAFDDPELMVPADFTIGALARSPLPAGADPDDLLAGMEASLASFSDADLASLLVGAGRIGLINTDALDTITVDSAETADLGGRPAIEVRGTADFGPDAKPKLNILVLLAWTDDSFFTFYGITSKAAWEEMEPVLLEISETVGLP